jgi:uncharacterized protein YcfJ
MKIGKIALALGLSCGFLFAEMVKVTEVTKITKPYTTKVKVGENCYEDTVEVEVKCGDTDTNAIGIDTLIGATIGVVVGNQIGRGNGRDAAKIIGGLGGAYAANKMNRQKICKSYETVTKCEPKYEYKTEYRTVGYNNCAMIDGVKYCKQTKEPIEYLTIKKTVTVY